MQVTINPNIYGQAQLYAERRGLDLTAVIEDFLVKFMASDEDVDEIIRKYLEENINEMHVS